MTLEEMNSYRLTSMEEPGDERMAWIMREVAEEARENSRRAHEQLLARIDAAAKEAKERVGTMIEQIKNGNY